jgi:uncharacterized protein
MTNGKIEQDAEVEAQNKSSIQSSFSTITTTDPSNNNINPHRDTNQDIFDNLDDTFFAKLREISQITRNTSDGKSTITFRTTRIEAKYSTKVMRNLEPGRLIAIPNVLGLGDRNVFSIYEIADVYPLHFSMLTLDKNQPGAIRNEFMDLIGQEWEKNSCNTWIEIVAASTGYVLYIDDKNNNEVKFERKNAAILVGSAVHLLSKEFIQDFICYKTNDPVLEKHYTIGSILGVTDQQIPFTVNLEKLLHYHVGVFAFTGAGKSNLTSHIIRKSLRSVKNTKFIIFDVSSEYAVNILDQLNEYPSRVILVDSFDEKHFQALNNINDQAVQDETKKEKFNQTVDYLSKDFLKRHVCPEALSNNKDDLLKIVKKIIIDDKVRVLEPKTEAEQKIDQFSTYGGLISSLSDILNDKFGAASQKVLIPLIVQMIKSFLKKNNLNDSSQIDARAEPLIKEINDRLAQAKLRADAAILGLFHNLKMTIEFPVDNVSPFPPDSSTSSTSSTPTKDSGSKPYNIDNLLTEIMDESETSPKIFVIDLPEADTARTFCADVINKVFRIRKSTFTLNPRVVFVFDEAQEFIPYEKRKEDGTEYSSKAVEKLLRHGRKYFLHGWISTQRIANLNTNALQQLHSYFESTMPRPYDRQLISDTFAIDDAFVDRTLMFQNGDWLMTSFKATNTQNVPVFFHAINNEDCVLKDC